MVATVLTAPRSAPQWAVHSNCARGYTAERPLSLSATEEPIIVYLVYLVVITLQPVVHAAVRSILMMAHIDDVIRTAHAAQHRPNPRISCAAPAPSLFASAASPNVTLLPDFHRSTSNATTSSCGLPAMHSPSIRTSRIPSLIPACWMRVVIRNDAHVSRRNLVRMR